MPESKTRTAKYAIAYGQAIFGSYDIKLLPLKESTDGKDPYTATISEDTLLQNIIPNKRNFYYTIEHVSCRTINQKCIVKETGYGEIYKKGKNYYLKREVTLKFFDGHNEYNTVPTSKHSFYPTDTLLIKSTVPDEYINIFAYPYSVLCSIEQFNPTPVELEEKTLLGRLNDEIQSIDKDELREILTDDNIIKAVTENKEDLNLNSSINIINENANLLSNSITIKPSYSNSHKPKNPVRGTIIYNADENCFEGYDGSRWRSLKWTDE